MIKILGLGNALVDLIIDINDESILKAFELPKGSMTLVDEEKASGVLEATRDLPHRVAAGGSASNTIDGLASLGIECGYIGKIGDDPYGELFRKEMESNHIVPILLTGEKQTGTAITLLTEDAERTFATYLGAAVELKPTDLMEDQFRAYNLLHVEGYLVQNHELISHAVKLANNYGMTVSMDMASYNIVEANNTFLIDLIKKYVDIVFANEDEARSLTDKNPEEALHEIAGWCDIAVVKTGKNGSWIQRGSEVYKIEAIQAILKDTTGAGDLYASGFLYAMSEELDLQSCGRIGSLVGGKIVEVYGARMENTRWEEIRTGIKEIIDKVNQR